MPTAEEFQRWRASRGEAATPVELLRVEEEALVLGFSRPSGECGATVCLSPIEDSSFFCEGLEDPSDEVEDWLTEVNSYLSEKSKLTLGSVIEVLLQKAPHSFTGKAGARGKDMEEDECEEEEEDEDDEVMESVTIEAASTRQDQRESYAEERRWDTMVTSSASQGSRQASQVLMREMRNLTALRGDGQSQALEIDMVQDSLYHWCVTMHAEGFPESCELRKELQRFGAEHVSGLAAVVFDVRFPNTYPMEPPFIRVVRPRFAMHTGHITIGGSVCMQLLTPSGWLPTVSLENVFVSIRSEMVEGGGRLDFSQKWDYTMQEAREAFNRVAQRYGWSKA